MAGRFGAIPGNVSLGAGQSVRRNAGDTGFEAYTPSAGSGLSDGDYGDITVSGGGTVMSIDAGVSVTLSNTGLNVRDGGNDHTLRIRPAEDLTANRVLSITVNDANRALTIAADATISGTNTGDQTLNGLLPTQTGNNGKVLTTDGSNASWETPSGGSGLTQPQVMARTLGC